MMTLLQSALTGWTDYTQHGKFAALLLLAILYLGFVLYGSGKEANASGAEKARKRLYLYGALVTFGCICPVTALILLKYQTTFYSYIWIWAAVPQTALIAWAATDFLCNLSKEKSLRNGMAALILLGILFLGGNPVSEWTVAQTTQIPALTGMPGQQQGTPAREILEQLSVDNAEKGLTKACAATGAQIIDYSAAPVFMDEHAKCRHQWLIEFAKMPDSVEKFAAILDATLKEVNSDYEAKRWKDIALQPLEVIVARPGLFHDWLAQKGKLGGQHKVPRLSNTREYIESMLVLNNE